jgi:hypothetical protein
VRLNRARSADRRRWGYRLLSFSKFVSANAVAGASWAFGVNNAHADCSDNRPTSASVPYAFDFPVQTFDTEHVRVHYALDGVNAVRHDTAPPPDVPRDVVVVATRAEEAYIAFRDRGYRMPIDDSRPTPCLPGGGDTRLDVYLVAFRSADGQTVAERCVASKCSTYLLADARLDRRYASVDEGVLTVLPHELFHAVQFAYSDNVSGFFAEGSAQWAAASVSGSDADLRRFLPDFFWEADRPLDVAPAGATAGFLYGAAIWSVFLTQRYAERTLQATLGYQLANANATTLSASDTALRDEGTTLSEAFAEFALYNLATGARASTAGYVHASTYPMVAVADFPNSAGGPSDGGMTSAVEGTISGYALRARCGPLVIQRKSQSPTFQAPTPLTSH